MNHTETELFQARRARALAGLLLFAALTVFAGCAAKETAAPAPPPAREAGITPSVATAESLPADSASEAAPDSTSGVAPEAPARAAGEAAKEGLPKAESHKAKGTHPSPAEQMLASAGRDPKAPQPEAGFSLQLPKNVKDGEAFLFEFAAGDAKEVSIRWRNKEMRLTERNPASGSFQALLPVPLDYKGKPLPISMNVLWNSGKTERFSAEMPVRSGKYPVQRLKVDQKHVTPPKSELPRIERERAEWNAVVAKVSPVQYWALPFKRPVPGVVTSLYGSRRVFNDVPKNPHKGVDFDAKADDPIYAAEGGTVVMASDRYYSGNTVIVDHGLGVMTAYLHMSAFNVAVGQKVERGDVLGFIGSTGRSTGPHLHLSLLVFGVSVNAAPCVAM